MLLSLEPVAKHRQATLRFGGWLPAACDVDVGAFFDELLGRSEADTGTASRYKSNLTFEFSDILFSLVAVVTSVAFIATLRNPGSG